MHMELEALYWLPGGGLVDISDYHISFSQYRWEAEKPCYFPGRGRLGQQV